VARFEPPGAKRKDRVSAIRRNEFSWSLTRDAVFRECPRKYYYAYYGSWGGWEPEAPERTRELYVLGKLKSRSLWVGEVVHSCIAQSLQNLARRIPVLPLEQIREITRKRMRTDFRDSRSGRYRMDPSRYCGLFEHEYGLEVSDQEWREVAEQVDRCLENFYRSEVFRSFREMDPQGILEVERFSQFDFEGVPLRIRLDAVCREDDRIVVWDWKSGRRGSPGESLQMACYIAYAMKNYRVAPEQIEGRRFELLHPSLHRQRMTPGALEELFSYIRGSIRDMQGLLEDPERNLAREERFAKVERRSICLRCNFLKVCQPHLED